MEIGNKLLMASIITPGINYYPVEFDRFKDKQNVLSIVVESNGLAFFISDKNGQLQQFEKYSFSITSNIDIIVSNLGAILDKEQYCEKFIKTNLIFKNNRISLAPSQIRIGEENFNNLDFDYNQTEEQIHKSSVAESVTAYFPINKSIVDLVKQRYSVIEILSHDALFFGQGFEEAKKNQAPTFLLDIKDKYFSAIVFENGNVLLANNFEYEGKDDFGYFALGIINNLNLDANIVNLKIGGAILPESVLFKLLERFVAKINISNLAESAEQLKSELVITNFLSSANN